MTKDVELLEETRKSIIECNAETAQKVSQLLNLN